MCVNQAIATFSNLDVIAIWKEREDLLFPSEILFINATLIKFRWNFRHVNELNIPVLMFCGDNESLFLRSLSCVDGTQPLFFRKLVHNFDSYIIRTIIATINLNCENLVSAKMDSL